MNSVTKRLEETLGNNSFLRHVSVLTGGTVFAQGIAALSLPILTRLYTPDDFSVLAAYVAVIAIVSTISCLRLNIAIPLPEMDEDAINLLALSMIFSTLISFTLAVLGALLPPDVLHHPGPERLYRYFWMVPIGVWLASLYDALQYWASRKKRFPLITRTRMTRALGGAGAQTSIGILFKDPFGLLFGHMISGGLGVFELQRSMRRRDWRICTAITAPAMMRNLHFYRRFPQFSVLESLFDVAAVQLPILIIATSSVSSEAGFLMVAMRLMGLPMSLIGASVGQVYLVEAPMRLRAGTLGKFTRETMLYLLKIGAPPLCLIGSVSPFAFPLAFGTEWSRAGDIVAEMIPYIILQFVVSPVSAILHVTGRQFTAMVLQTNSLLLRLGAVLGALAFTPEMTVEAYLIASAVFAALYCFAVFQITLRYTE
jgi:O-antigen/teichoic acid export membrane protein